jgi:hypothetical protein
MVELYIHSPIHLHGPPPHISSWNCITTTTTTTTTTIIIIIIEGGTEGKRLERRDRESERENG